MSGTKQKTSAGISYKKPLIILAIILAALSLFFGLTVFSAGKMLTVFSTSADFSNTSSLDISALNRCRLLRNLDISNTGTTDIKPLYESETFDRLEYINLNDNLIPLEQIVSFHNCYPNCEIDFTCGMGKNRITSNDVYIKLTDETSELFPILSLCENLQQADITACSNIDSLIESSEYADGEYVLKLELCGKEAYNNATNLELDKPSETDLKKILLFTKPENIVLNNPTLCKTLFLIEETFPACDIRWTFDLFGVSVSNADEKISMNRANVADIDTFTAALQYLPNLKHIDMCGCGLSNEQMEQLAESFPDIKFVWEITFGHTPVFWTVRTDITCFSSLGMIRCSDEEIAPLLKYCTDLVALDLGHHNISDMRPFANLKKLQVLILGDNPISDISPLAELKELQYIEIFSCRITDISPLAELPNLIDVCMGNNPVKDTTVFHSMTQLKMLWIPRCNIDSEARTAISEALPDCRIKYQVIDNLCEDWRVTDRNVAIRKAFKNWKYVISYNSWDDVVYMDGVNLIETTIDPLT